MMFLHPTEDYDFLVQLDPKVLPRYFHNINPDNNLLLKRGKYANKLNEKDVPVFPGFDPARLLFDDLKVCVNSLLLILIIGFVIIHLTIRLANIYRHVQDLL